MEFEYREEPGLFVLRCNLTDRSIALLEEEIKFLKQKKAIIEAKAKKHIRKTLIAHQTNEIHLKFIPSIANIDKLKMLLDIEYEGLFEVKVTSHKTIIIDGEQYITPKDALFMGH